MMHDAVQGAIAGGAIAMLGGLLKDLIAVWREKQNADLARRRERADELRLIYLKVLETINLAALNLQRFGKEVPDETLAQIAAHVRLDSRDEIQHAWPRLVEAMHKYDRELDVAYPDRHRRNPDTPLRAVPGSALALASDGLNRCLDFIGASMLDHIAEFDPTRARKTTQ
jgi:hypothetical protein